MSKIIIEVPDKCSDCKHRKSNICLLFEKTIGGGYNSNLYVRCPNCIAAEVKEENKLPKYKEGHTVLDKTTGLFVDEEVKEEKEK